MDAFTTASPVYRAAMRHPHKSGSAFQTFDRPGRMRPLAAIATVFIVAMAVIGALL